MKKIRYILGALAAITGLAVLAACAQIVAPSAQTAAPSAYPDGGTTGRVLLSVSTGAEKARTILPTDEPVFSRYEVEFANDYTIVSVDDTSGITGAGVNQELAAGTWTVRVRAYQQFTPTDGTETEYLAAQGSESVTVWEGEITPVTVPLTPVPITESWVNGIFTYTVTFPDGVTEAYLTISGRGSVTLIPGQTVSVEAYPGYYDLFIMLRKGPLTAGAAEKLHIYSGLESKAEFTFEDVDFFQPVPLEYKTWAEGNLASDGQVDWYSFSATAGLAYSLEFDSLGDTGNYTGEVYVTAFGSDGGWLNYSNYSPLTLYVQTDDTIYVSVQVNGALGTYAVRYYAPSTEPPDAAPSYVQIGMPQPDYTITWNSVDRATGYKVSRSTTREGSYDDIGSEVPDYGSYSYSFTDTGVSSGTYWYKVRAVNQNGEGPDSEPVSTPTLLPNDKTWAEGNLSADGQLDWYSFPATAGVTYILELDSLGGTGNYTGEVHVAAYRGSDGEYLGSSSEYSSPLTLSVQTDDTIYVSVSYNGAPGTYAVRYYYDPLAAPSYVQMRIPQPDYTITWDPVDGATGYKVSRSATKEGPYTVRGSTVPADGSYSYSFTDTGVSSGTYWYKVRAVNGLAEGPDSAPVSTPTLLLNDKTWAEGNLTADWQVDWYSLSATAGVTYNLQFDSLDDGTGDYTGSVYISLFNSDGNNFYGNSEGYSSPMTLNVDTGDTIYVSVSVYSTLGTYAVRYYDPDAPSFYTVSGAITTSDNAGVSGASVQLKQGGASVGPAVSPNADGAYTITGVPAGTYTIEVSLAGYYTGTITGITVSDANVTGKNLVLHPTIDPLRSLPTIATYLAGADGGGPDNPVLLPVDLYLTTTNLQGIFSAIETEGKCVSLDLTACTMPGTTFNPGEANAELIMSLTLPAAATSISGGSSPSSSVFRNFTSLRSVTGSTVTSIPEYAFYERTTLTTVSFPVATSIGGEAFYNCFALTTADFPLVTSIGSRAFYRCFALTTVSFPAATSIGYNAFEGCTVLTTVSFPAATSIDGSAFSGCTALTTVSFPAATSIGQNAFRNTGETALAIILPQNAPSINSYSSNSDTYSKTVTVKTPAGRTGYGTTWENWFKRTFGDNATITLIFEDLE